MQIVFLPLAIFLIIACPRIILRALFYNKTTKEWEGKIWQYYTVYAVLTAIFFFLCTLPLMSNVYIQIGNFYTLATKHKKFVECQKEHEELSEKLPDTEFILVYEVLRSSSSEEIVNDILPAIIAYQGRFSDWHIFDDHDYRIEDYEIQYDSENKLYLLYLDQEVAAKIEVKNTLFFKKIYFHGYWVIYQERTAYFIRNRTGSV